MAPQTLLLSLLLTGGLAVPACAAPAPAAPPRKTARPTVAPPARPGAKKARTRPVPVEPRKDVDPTADWKHRFTLSQRRRLHQAGCRFDADDRAIADGLHTRGFDAEQVTRAWELTAQKAASQRKHVPAAAVFLLLKLPQSKLQHYLRSGLSLSDWYNRRYQRGDTRVLAGWVLTGAGIAGILTGVALMLFYPRSDAEAAEVGKDSCGGACGAVSLGGLAGFALSWGTAVTLFAAGLPILLDGYARKKRWVKGQLLDTGSADDIQGKKRRAHLRRLHRSRRARLRLQPHLGPTGGGLTLGVRF